MNQKQSPSSETSYRTQIWNSFQLRYNTSEEEIHNYFTIKASFEINKLA